MIRFYKPTLKRNDMDCVLQTMADEHIGPGERTKLFNQSFSEVVGCKYAVSLRTYPDCIRKAFDILGVSRESAVAISPLAPDVYRTVLDEIGCRVVFVDVDRENGMPTEEAVARSNADVLILYENCSSLPMVYNSETTFFEKQDYGNIRILEDVTESFGSVLSDEARAGDWGDVVICALEENNVVSAGGGAVLAVKQKFVEEVKSRKISKLESLADLNAALGFVQIENFRENSVKRNEICNLYQNGMASSKHKRFGFNGLEFKGNGGYFAVLLDCKPEEVIRFAQKKDVPVVRTFADSMCAGLEGDLFEKFPNSAVFYYRTVSFPIYPFLKAEEVKVISRIIANLP